MSKTKIPQVKQTDKSLAERRAEASYEARPGQVKRREQRNKARRIMERKGLVAKGDGKDVDHRDHNTSNESSKNLRVESASKNRSTNRRYESGRLVRLKK